MADPGASMRPAIDWAAAQARIAAFRGRSDGDLPAEETARILEERARRYAGPARGNAGAVVPSDAVPLFVFSIGGGRVAIDTTVVVAVTAFEAVMPVPCTPPHIRGVAHLRSRLVTVLDLAPLLGTAALTAAPTRIIVIAVRGGTIGLAAEAIQGRAPVVLPPERRPPPGQPIWVGAAGGGLVYVDIGEMIADSDVQVNEHVSVGG